MGKKFELSLILAAFAANACAHTEQAQDPLTAEDAEERAAPVATSEPTKSADKPANQSAPNGQVMDEATRATFRGVITKPGAPP
jgi:hypothetical protein